jgi:hypothetical protein
MCPHTAVSVRRTRLSRSEESELGRENRDSSPEQHSSLFLFLFFFLFVLVFSSKIQSYEPNSNLIAHFKDSA